MKAYRREWKRGKDNAVVTLFKTEIGGPGYIACAYRTIGNLSEEFIGTGRTPATAAQAVARSDAAKWAWPDDAEVKSLLLQWARDLAKKRKAGGK